MKKIYAFILIIFITFILAKNNVQAATQDGSPLVSDDKTKITVFEGYDIKVRYDKIMKNNEYMDCVVINGEEKGHWWENEDILVDLVNVNNIFSKKYKEISIKPKKVTSKTIKVGIKGANSGNVQEINIQILEPLNVTAYEGTKEGKFDNSIDLEQKFKNWGISSLKIGSNSVSIEASEGTDFNSKPKKIGKTQYNLYEQTNYDVYTKFAYVRFRGKNKRRIRWKYSS